MAVKRWNGTAWEVYAGADLAPVKVTDGRVGKTTFIGATSPTGQVDGDIWIDQDTTTNAVVPTALTTKGDTFVATGNAAYTRLAAGSNGESLFADSSTNTGLRWQGDYNTGKNKILNGDFSIWQRTTSYTPTNSNTQYGSADRWMTFYNGGAVGTNTVSRQTFTPGQTAVPGNPTYFIRTATNGSATQNATDYYQRVEDVSTFGGQTVTLSFWAQSSNSGTIALYVDQNFGSGGSATVEPTITPSAANFTTTWAKYTATVTLPSISGKTVGSGNFVGFRIRNFSTLTSGTFDIAQVQLELGSVATPFTTATGNPQGELAACQRYYEKSYSQGTDPGASVFAGISGNASGADSTGYTACVTTFKVTKRTPPSIVVYDTSGNINRVTSFRNDGTNTANKTATVDPVSDTAFRIYETGTLKNGLFYHYVASAEL